MIGTIKSGNSVLFIAAFAALVFLPRVDAQATWRPMPELSVRSGHAMAYDPVRQRVVLFGGGHNGSTMADTWEWDGKRWELLRPAVSPPPRYASRMAYDPVRKSMLLFGGYTTDSRISQRTWLSETWEWDGRIWSQLKPATSPIRRQSTGMATDWARSRIVLFGGFTDAGAGFFLRPLKDTWEWDGLNWTQRSPQTVPPARGTQSFAFNAKTKRIAMFGGHPEGHWFTDTWEWDGKDWITFSPKISPPAAYSRMVPDPITGGSLLYSGGFQTHIKPGTWHWDGQSWTDLAQTLNTGVRSGHMLASDPVKRQIVLFGGYGGPGRVPWRDTWSWDGKTWTKVHDWPFPEEPNGIAVHDGARDEFVVLQPPLRGWLPAKTWVMSDGVFRRLYPATSPRIYGYNALLYHPGLKKVLYLYGDGQAKELWFWDGKSWTQTSYQTGPDGRNAHLAWDGHRQKVMEYDPTTGDLWEWDPKGWVRLAATSPPPRRSSTAFGYDPVRRRLVLFGGLPPSGSVHSLDDTWEWDGARWQKMSPKTSPQSRYAPGMAYVPALGGMVLFAGRGSVGPRTEPLDDTWLWDGKDWRKLAMPPLPTVNLMVGTAYPLLSAAYDAGRQRLVAFYGFSNHPAKCLLEFFFESLTTMQPYPRPGETFRLQIHLPGQAGKIFMLALSTAVRPGIPLRTVPGLGVELLPLSPDPLFWSSLNLWMLTQLDAQGNGTIPMAVPNNKALIGLQVHAAGGAVDLSTGVTAITNDVALKIVK